MTNWWVGGQAVQDVLQDLKAHRKLETLVLEGVEDTTLPVLTGIKSDSISSISLMTPDLLPILQFLRATIPEINVEFASSSSLRVQCPLVHTLSLTVSCPLDTRTLVLAFPNLKHFHYHIGDNDEDIDPLSLRRANRDDLAQHNKSWTSLRSLFGDIIKLYALGLSCHVHELTTSDITPSEVERYLVLLEDFTPRMTTLRFAINVFSLASLAEVLPLVFEQLNLSCTHLKLEFRSWNDKFDIHKLIVRLFFVHMLHSLTFKCSLY